MTVPVKLLNVKKTIVIYNFYSNCKQQCRSASAGGLELNIKHNFKTAMIEEISFTEDCMESLFLRSSSVGSNLIVGNIYHVTWGTLSRNLWRKPQKIKSLLAEFLGNSKSDRSIGDGIKTNHANEFFTKIKHNLRKQFIENVSLSHT